MNKLFSCINTKSGNK